MLYFGWIPILTDELLLSKCTDISLRNSRFIENYYILLPTKHLLKEVELINFLSSLKSSIENIPDSRTLLLFFNFDDMISTKLAVALLPINTQGKIDKVTILKYPTQQLLTSADISAIEPNGLISFQLNQSNLTTRKASDLVFACIRDFYHVHIFARSGDFHLYPVCADTADEAINKIYKQYQEKIIDYISEISNTGYILKNRGSAATFRSLRDLLLSATQAEGEMSYANHFCKLFGKETCSISSASFSLNLLKERSHLLLEHKLAFEGIKILALTSNLWR